MSHESPPGNLLRELLKQLDFKALFENGESFGRASYAIEGPVCSGKSSALDWLSSEQNAIIQEYSEYVSSATNDFPKFPPKSEEQMKQDFIFFLELEEKRVQDAVLIPSHKNVLLDRSIFTLLAFQASVARLCDFNILAWAMKYISKKEGGFIMPEHIIYLDVDAETSRKRVEEGSINIAPFLLSDEFNEEFRKFFIELKSLHPSFVTIVDGTKDQETVQRKIKSIIDSK